MDKPILQMRAISKSYPGVQALDNVHLSVSAGEVHGLMGENGAGKSTLIKVLSGAIQPDSGLIEFDGSEYEHLDPRTAMDIGIGVIYQELNLVQSMSVADNIFLGDDLGDGAFYDPKQVNARAKELLFRLGIELKPNQIVRELTIAYQQMVEIAKAVSKNVKLLVMDEPTAPLSSSEVRQLFRLIDRLKEDGIAIIYISHRMEEIFQLTENVTVLRDGKLIGDYVSQDIDRPGLIRAMVGRELSEAYPEGCYAKDEVVLEVKRLSGNGFKDISFKLNKGEILGVGGLVGAGRTDVVQAIFGANLCIDGEILVNGKPVRINSPKDAVEAGIALIPEDRKHQGLLLSMNVRENITLAALQEFSNLGFVDAKREAEMVASRIDELRIKTPSADQIVRTLSGGNQQKVVIAKWLATHPQILIMDEPTRGIDVGAKHEIYELMKELAKQGYAILMVSSDMPELLGVSDRIIVMRRGKISGEMHQTQANQEKILELAAH